jgi:hypothetical protein
MGVRFIFNNVLGGSFRYAGKDSWTAVIRPGYQEWRLELSKFCRYAGEGRSYPSAGHAPG